MLLPSAFVEQTNKLLGDVEYALLEKALNENSPVSVRVNRKMPSQLFSCQHLDAVPWCADGYYLNERLTFTFDPLFHAGCYYVQEASSMFVEQALKQYICKPSVMLDLCAAPGGKSTHVRSMLPEGSLLVANEVIRNRSQVLSENIIKWGHPDVVVTNNDPSDFSRLTNFFDVILTDVPCSGEGMFRKDPASIEEWNVDNVNICYQRQRRIVADVWNSLKPGGILIYSTCTYNTKEDEENVRWISEELGAEVLPVATSAEWNIVGNLLGEDFHVAHFLPHRTRGEGFFLAVLRKIDGVSENFRKASSKKNNSPAIVPKQAKEWLLHPQDYLLEVKGNNVVAFAKVHQEEYELLKDNLRIVYAGVVVGEIKGKDLLPHQSLAMSSELNLSAFPSVELTYLQSIAYLRKEAITLDVDIPRGFVLLLYKGVALGFVKNIGNRANNLYPNEWRIRSGYLPEKILIFTDNSL
ncbi:MAG: rRNA cytosine-C5-methyltransferase [Bacteroides sp.]